MGYKFFVDGIFLIEEKVEVIKFVFILENVI